MRIGLIILVVVSLLLLGSEFVSVRTSLAGERQAIDTAWTQVDAALEERAGIVPDLIQAMQQDAPAETTTMKAVAGARAALDRAKDPREKIQANALLDDALGGLLVRAENYPKLENSKDLSELEDALKEAEYHIAVERRKYNEAVEHYNTRIALFPNNVVASVSRLGKIDAYFQTGVAPPASPVALP